MLIWIFFFSYAPPPNFEGGIQMKWLISILFNERDHACGLTVRCGFIFILWCLRCIKPHAWPKTTCMVSFIFILRLHVRCGVVRCGLSLAKTITAPHLIFVVTYAVRYIRCGLNDLKYVYFSNFKFFLPSQKLIFPFVLVQVLNYWASFSLFWVSFLNQHLLGLSNFFLQHHQNQSPGLERFGGHCTLLGISAK